jgi:hypothetical protein
MRGKRMTKWIALLAAVAMSLWAINPTWAESGCHKVKGKGGGSTQTILVVDSPSA